MITMMLVKKVLNGWELKSSVNPHTLQLKSFNGINHYLQDMMSQMPIVLMMR